jgi:hypothetical protein
MLLITFNSNFKSIIYNLLNNKLKYHYNINNNKILLNKQDYIKFKKILNNNHINFKITK